jgi:sugar lactone lactonase YvrE
LTIDGADNLYVADTLNSTIRKITPAGVVTTLAGTAGVYGSADGVGPAAQFNLPEGIVADHDGNLYVSDGNQTIRRVSPSGVVTTIAGETGVIGSADGIGSAANFYGPSGLALDAVGNLYVAEYGNVAIRKGTLAGPPVITAQPQSQSVQAGEKVLLSATITSSLPLTYQWYLNNAAIAGANGSFLEIQSASFASGGSYTLTASNQLGSVTTNAAVLTVAPIPATSGGGGSMEPWFALALLGLGLARRGQKRNAYFSRTRFEVR